MEDGNAKVRLWIHFNPRSPRGERRADRVHPPGSAPHFNPRSPRGERRTTNNDGTTTGNNFNPRSPRGERRGSIGRNIVQGLFQSTLPAGGATSCKPLLQQNKRRFQSTLPAGGATCAASSPPSWGGYFNPRSPRGSDIPQAVVAAGRLISIHAPRGGSDDYQAWVAEYLNISIHAPRGGSDVAGKPDTK